MSRAFAILDESCMGRGLSKKENDFLRENPQPQAIVVHDEIVLKKISKIKKEAQLSFSASDIIFRADKFHKI
jgi:hypothetical protein